MIMLSCEHSPCEFTTSLNEWPGEVYIIGETFTGDGDEGRHLIMNYVNDYELDGQFDFPLFYAIGMPLSMAAIYRLRSGQCSRC